MNGRCFFCGRVWRFQKILSSIEACLVPAKAKLAGEKPAGHGMRRPVPCRIANHLSDHSFSISVPINRSFPETDSFWILFGLFQAGTLSLATAKVIVSLLLRMITLSPAIFSTGLVCLFNTIS